MNGGWDKLTDEERAFVGVGLPNAFGSSNGWRSPIANLIDQLGGGMPAADLRMLERLGGMDNPGQERLRFLGG